MRPTRPGLRLRLLVNLMYAAALVGAALAPAVPGAAAGVSDFWLHVAAYGVQAGLVLWALAPVAPPLAAAAASVSAAALLGGLTESLQGLVQSRSSEARDLAADVAGAAAVVVFWLGGRAVAWHLRGGVQSGR